MHTQRITLEIYGLGCGGGGALAVERALTRVKGVVHAYANPATETAYAQYDPALVQPAHLVRAIEEVGFRTGEPILR